MMDLGVSPADALLAIAIVASGAALQAVVGFGLALVAAPLLVMLDPLFVPGPITASALFLTVWMALRERAAIDVRGLKVAVGGRLLGTPPGAIAVGWLSSAAFDVLFGVLVLAAVAISMVHPHIRPTGRAVFVASTASGFMGTVSSIGGPPIALVYQHSEGPELRATLASMFAAGCIISLVGLALVGRFGPPELVRAAILLPGVALGLGVSRFLTGVLDPGATRPLILGLSSVSALFVLARVLL